MMVSLQQLLGGTQADSSAILDIPQRVLTAEEQAAQVNMIDEFALELHDLRRILADRPQPLHDPLEKLFDKVEEVCETLEQLPEASSEADVEWPSIFIAKRTFPFESIARTMNSLAGDTDPEDLEDVYQGVDPNYVAKLHESFKRLGTISDCLNEMGALEAHTFEIKVIATPEQMEQVVSRLKAEITAAATGIQADIAAEHNYVPGVTTCCEKHGYNPPADSGVRPVHDFVFSDCEADDDEEPNGAQVLQRIFGGLMQLS